ncbi:MAG TPA: hypothetical protein PKZ97_09545 [Azospirillaceae bacterium]|nr:hypothetical protein [Azospirillaceae bacterium]
MSAAAKVAAGSSQTAAAKVAASWGPTPPDWLAALAAECDQTSQNKAAARIGVSSAVVSQVLAGKYPGNLEAVADKVRASLLAHTVDCPAMGVMDLSVCLDWRIKAKTFHPTSALRGRMFDACGFCPNNKD